MSRRLNISIPDELDKEIKAWGSTLNISRVCQEAIFCEIDRLKSEMINRRRSLEEIKSKIFKRREALIKLANSTNHTADAIDVTDRAHIKSYLEKGEIPKKPINSVQLTKVYASSCLSNPIIRRQMVKLIGQIPTPETISECLNIVFDCSHFQDEYYWLPINMVDLTFTIQAQEGFTNKDLSSLKFKPRIIAIMMDGANFIEKKTQASLNSFYDEINAVTDHGPESIWRYVKEISKPLRHVGPALICDFLKNIGFSEFVRVDGYFKSEFPGLINENAMTEKRQFLVSLDLCQELGIKPFHFDHIMYQWGRYKKLI